MSAGSSSPRMKLAWLASGALLVCGFLVFHAWTPRGMSTCLLYNVTGTCCPGCGMTRATSLLAHGRLVDSLRMHPLALPFALEAGVAWAWWGLVAFGRRRPPSPWVAIVPMSLDVVALLVTWLVRWKLGLLPN